MDVQMPEMDGFEATKAIRKAEGEKRKAETAPPSSSTLHPSSFSSRLPIIAMTAHALRGDRERCLRAGMDDYISKPINLSALSAMLEKWLPKAEPSEAAGASPEGAAFHSPGQASAAPWVTAKMPPCPEGSASPAVFDRAALMGRLQNNEKLAQRVLDGFLEDLPGQLEQLKIHAAAGDARQVELQAHQIKGACATVGGDALSALAAALEQAGQDGDLAGIAARMREVDAQFAALKAAMQEAV
jgi:CheY-like chemotaxis protein/HPt (histidine-containing phosphotransfer) domain-containing protein